MSEKVTKVEFLARVARVGKGGVRQDWLMVDSTYVSENIQIACEALSLKLVRLVPDPLMFGHVLKITPGGLLLAQGKVVEAAQAIDSSLLPVRIGGEPPTGPVATKLYPGGPAISLGSLMAKNYAGEILRSIATGHIVVSDGMMVAVDPTFRRRGILDSNQRQFVALNDDRQRHVGRRRMG